jgi:AcrR family transcriptional regulator
VTAQLTKRRPGRHRSEAAGETILATTLDCLREYGYDGLTMAGVIDRAGVSSATLYRRWATKPELVAAAVEFLAPEPTELDTGSLVGDVTALLRHIADAYATRNAFGESMLGDAKLDDELTKMIYERIVGPRIRLLGSILDRATARGELVDPPPAEVAHALLVGPLYYRLKASLQAITPAFLAQVTSHGLRGFGARQP